MGDIITLRPLVHLCSFHPYAAHLTPYWAAQGYRVSHGICPDCMPAYCEWAGVELPAKYRVADGSIKVRAR